MRKPLGARNERRRGRDVARDGEQNGNARENVAGGARRKLPGTPGVASLDLGPPSADGFGSLDEQSASRGVNSAEHIRQQNRAGAGSVALTPAGHSAPAGGREAEANPFGDLNGQPERRPQQPPTQSEPGQPVAGAITAAQPLRWDAATGWESRAERKNSPTGGQNPRVFARRCHRSCRRRSGSARDRCEGRFRHAESFPGRERRLPAIGRAAKSHMAGRARIRWNRRNGSPRQLQLPNQMGQNKSKPGELRRRRASRWITTRWTSTRSPRIRRRPASAASFTCSKIRTDRAEPRRAGATPGGLNCKERTPRALAGVATERTPPMATSRAFGNPERRRPARFATAACSSSPRTSQAPSAFSASTSSVEHDDSSPGAGARSPSASDDPFGGDRSATGGHGFAEGFRDRALPVGWKVASRSRDDCRAALVLSPPLRRPATPATTTSCSLRTISGRSPARSTAHRGTSRRWPN